ncbi:phytoene desaturase family protein [Herbidospora yilanensis]|uniref:phytoene desaturase family protein n=1 Tax=Herbidospora yilanensis TaxID=354426 RepID=UPI000784AA64|nr:NAD(P)/FAD-dependent oxidoreductase [Herbidospora yilanensis]
MFDVVIAGAGHNGLVAAAYLARAGRSVLLLERFGHVGGLAVSAQAFPGVEARVSRYSYLVSLLPSKVVTDLGLPLDLRRRRFSSYTPVGDGGLLVDGGDDDRTAASFANVTGSGHEIVAWRRFYAMTAAAATAVAPTLIEPLMPRERLRDLVGEAWTDLFERPIGQVVNERFADDVVRGVVLTDALIGTFADPDADLLANRCFLYHVIGDGTGDWNVPVGGMGAVTGGLAEIARKAGAQIRVNAEVVAIDPATGEVTYRDESGEHTVTGGKVLANLPPFTLARLLGEEVPERPEGAQLKINMVLKRLPRLKDPSVDPREAFSGTFHINESRDQLAAAFRQASAGEIPGLPPAEVYCHSLTDPSILGADLRASGAQTMTLFGLHMPARLFDRPEAKEEAVRRTLASIDSVLAEPIEDVLLPGCLEAKTPLDLEKDAALPGGHIFHQDLSWPYAEGEGRWGVETAHERLLLCGAGARRGGGVSGIPGHNAAMAVLGR